MEKKKKITTLSLCTRTHAHIYRKSQSKFEKQAKCNTKTDLAFSKINVFYYRETALVKRKQKQLNMNLIVTF